MCSHKVYATLQKQKSDFEIRTVAVPNSRTKEMINSAGKMWIRLEVKFLFSKLDDLQLKLYNLHLKLMSTIEEERWRIFCNSLYGETECQQTDNGVVRC